jgi:hypothetical protein
MQSAWLWFGMEYFYFHVVVLKRGIAAGRRCMMCLRKTTPDANSATMR